MIETSINDIEAGQGFEMSFALALMIIRAVNTTVIPDDLCSSTAGLASLSNFMNTAKN